MTQKELADATGLSRQRIAQLTNGYKKGKYYYPALLKSGLHYTWNEGNLFYYENAVLIIKSKKGGYEK